MAPRGKTRRRRNTSNQGDVTTDNAADPTCPESGRAATTAPVLTSTGNAQELQISATYPAGIRHAAPHSGHTVQPSASAANFPPPQRLGMASLVAYPTTSLLSSRLISRPIPSIGSIPSNSTACTASAIGISTPSLRARSTTDRVVATPSTTLVVRLR